jgi:hypothetical protein
MGKLSMKASVEGMEEEALLVVAVLTVGVCYSDVNTKWKEIALLKIYGCEKLEQSNF